MFLEGSKGLIMGYHRPGVQLAMYISTEVLATGPCSVRMYTQCDESVLSEAWYSCSTVVQVLYHVQGTQLHPWVSAKVLIIVQFIMEQLGESCESDVNACVNVVG